MTLSCIPHAALASGYVQNARAPDALLGVQIASQLDPADKSTIEKSVDETIAWLDSNQLAEVDELENRLKELEGKCGPIISKMYQGSQGAGEGAGPGDMPGRRPSCHLSSSCCQALCHAKGILILGLLKVVWEGLGS